MNDLCQEVMQQKPFESAGAGAGQHGAEVTLWQAGGGTVEAKEHGRRRKNY